MMVDICILYATQLPKSLAAAAGLVFTEGFGCWVLDQIMCACKTAISDHAGRHLWSEGDYTAYSHFHYRRDSFVLFETKRRSLVATPVSGDLSE